MNERSVRSARSQEEDPVKDAVIVGAVRPAISRKKGTVSPVRPDDLAEVVLA